MQLVFFQINLWVHTSWTMCNCHSILVSYLPEKFCSQSNWIHLTLKFADDPPNLSALRNFTVNHGSIDIAEKIGTNYEHFGTLLLNDNDGTKVKNIEMSKHGDPVHITVEILKQWRQGKGRRPVTWRTLVDCLRGTGLNVLADKIEHSLSSHNGSKDHSEL